MISVTLKAAISLDGRIATESGASRWITGEAARRHAHRLRAQHRAILVGSETVLVDDPRLDVRHVRGRNPVPVVLDTRLRLAARAELPRVVRAGTLVFHGPDAAASRRRRLRSAGAEGVVVAVRDGHVALRRVLAELERRGLDSVLVEGGARIHGAFIRARAWDRFFLYQAPRLLGEGPGVLAGVRFATIDRAPKLRVVARRRLGEDQLVVLAPA